MWSQSMRHGLDDITKRDTAQLRFGPALHNAIAVAVPLIAGYVTGHTLSGLGMAMGALVAAFAGMTGPLRKRVRTTFIVSVWMGVSTFVGGMAGNVGALIVALIGLSGLTTGLMTSVSATAAQIGLLTTNSLILVSQYAQGPVQALQHAGLAFAGGMLQIALLLLSDWFSPARAETEAVASVYAALANYADLLTRPADLQVASRLLEADTTLNDSYLRQDQWNRLRVLMNLAEMIRIDLVTLDRVAGMGKRDESADPGGAKGAFLANGEAAATRVEDANAACLGRGAHPAFSAAGQFLHAAGHAAAHASPGKKTMRVRTPLVDSGNVRLSKDPALRQLESLVEQMGSRQTRDSQQDFFVCLHQLVSKLMQVADVIDSPALDEAYVVAYAPHRVAPMQLRRMWFLIRANLTFRSPSFRHAVRLAAALMLAAAVSRTLQLPRGYWLPLTTGIILKPDFFSTFSRGTARMFGTVLGVLLASLLILIPDSSHLFGLALILGFAWSMYAVVNFNYALFSVFLTAEIVMLLSFFEHSSPLTAMVSRVAYTVAGSMWALTVYLLWPTWQRQNVPSSIGNWMAAMRQYFRSVMAQPGGSSSQVVQARKQARLARTNVTSVIEQFLQEPVHHALDASAVAGLVTALHRFSDTLLSLESRVGVEPHLAESPIVLAWVNQMDALLENIEQAVRAAEGNVMPLAFQTPQFGNLVDSFPTTAFTMGLVRLQEIAETMLRMVPIHTVS